MRKLIVVLVLVTLFLGGCSSSRQLRRRSNLMSYLSQDNSESLRQTSSDVRLQLPLRIGIAFVPSEIATGSDSLLPPDAEKRLTDIVRKSFAGRDWVSQIVTIPSNYLVSRGGFENLEQVARLMDVDVIALVSVDQLQVSDPRSFSFLYISVIGAYTLPLDRNETRTLIDAAVFHVPSRTFLLRAPGVSRITGNSTAVTVDASLREKSRRGFEAAMKDLAKNLDAEVGQFKESVASGERKDVDVYTSRGESVRSGGALGWWDALVAAFVAMAALRMRRP
ncbi:MAG TPA: rhombotarget lipoprotein [Thermoanaerobaculia bacterium]|nr:rhombotarget lipoprotein [Thermoanaerobaculia bacterium]